MLRSALLIITTCFYISPLCSAYAKEPLSGSLSSKSIIESFKDKAQQGHAAAQYNLALIFEEGMGSPKDLPQALKWYKRSAEQEYVRAQYKLGYLYYFGSESIRNYDQAVQWLNRAADQNDANAIYRLGSIYSDPDNLKYNMPLALSYFEDAARKGHRPAQLQLSHHLLTPGAQRDTVKSAIWLTVAQLHGSKEAIPLLSKVQKELSGDQLRLVRQASKEIYASIYDSPSDNYYFSTRDIDISNTVLATTNWLNTQNIHLDLSQLPEIKLLQKNEIVRAAIEIESQKGGNADEISILASYRSYENVPLRALYDGDKQTILMPEDWQYNAIDGQAELVHELTHHYQVISGKAETIACTGTLEKQAMRLQNAYLEANNLPAAFSETDIILMGDCDE